MTTKTPRPASTTDLVVAAAQLLGRQWTTRVIAELTDHGPIPLGLVAGTLSDLTHDQYTYGLRVLRDRGLIAYGKDTGRDCYVLTAAGEGLGDVHFAMSRWARNHGFPSRECDFVTRVDATLRLLRDRDLLAVLGGADTEPLAEPVGGAAVGMDTQAERSLTEAGFMYVVRDGVPTLTRAGRDLRGPLTALASWAQTHADLLQRRIDTRPGLRTTIPGPQRAPARRSV
jgi:DNA-binding HxlR family transcriptional regulator